MKTVTIDAGPVLTAAFANDLLDRVVKVADLATGAVPSSGPAATIHAAPEAVGTKGKVFRPNGEEYLPRKMTIGTSVSDDVSFIRKAYDERLPVLLYGEPGTGKTALVEAALHDDMERENRRIVVTVQGTVETEVADFVGSWVQQPDGTYLWVDGPLVIAMEGDGTRGYPLLVDEVALIDSRVMAVVYGPMDGRDELVVTANPARGVVKARPGFVVYGAYNPNVPGAIVSDALLSRFPIQIEMTTDWSIAHKLGVSKQITTVARNLNIKRESGELLSAPQLRELIAFKRVEETFGTELAISNFIGAVRPEDRAIAVAAVNAVFGREYKSLSL
jgi:nitric oxide reductase NorQ protein